MKKLSFKMNSMTKLLHEKLETLDIVKVAGAYDAMSAKIVEKHGFDAIWAGGFGITATRALPDASIMTMTEFLEASKNMVERCNIPVISDCDTGYGGPLNVAYMVKKFESSGIAAICIEDKRFPKQNSLFYEGNQDLISKQNFMEKLLAAKNAKKDPNFMIIARTEALIAGLGINEAIQRAEAYEEAGADAIFIHSKKNTPDEIFNFSKKWKGNIPLVIVPTAYPSVTLNELISNKIKIVVYAHQTVLAAYAAITDIVKELSVAQSLNDVKSKMASMYDIFKLQELDKIRDEEKNIQSKLKNIGHNT